MENINSENIEDKVLTLDDKFMKLQDHWVNIINEISDGLKDLFTMKDLQMRIYRDREILEKTICRCMATRVKAQREFAITQKRLFEQYKTDGVNGIRLSNDAQIWNMISLAKSDDEAVLELMDNNISFLKGTLKTLDSIIYALKDRLEIHKMIEGIKL